jgi:hypothetical protein
MNHLHRYSLNSVIPSRVDGEGLREVMQGNREISRLARDDGTYLPLRKTNSEQT